MVPVLEAAPWYQAFLRNRKHLKGYAIAQLKGFMTLLLGHCGFII